MPESTDKVIVVCTFFMVIFAGIQTHYLYQSNLISTSSSKSAQESVELARNTATNQLRAYVLASEGRVIGLDKGPMQVRVTIGNFGQTPAKEVIVTMDEECRDPTIAPSPPKAGAMGAMPTEEGMKATLAPGETLYIEHAIPTIRDQLKNKTITLHVCGTIHYKDVCGNTYHESFRFAQGGKYDPTSPLMGVD